ncbi:MAG: hypothetical protein KAR54_01030 [Candidatus Pacebacteria bacterium]|nr:hypothetical protein [Candidatus Paceibacterota bacterium]
MTNIETLIGEINTQIIAPIILFLFVLSIAMFFWGVADYIRGADNEIVRKTGRDHMIWGIIGIFIMVSAWAIIGIVLSTVGADLPKKPAGLF